jgi:PTS system ascorbate-specific IIA component
MTSILIIAHTPLASALAAVAEHTYPDCGALLRALDVQPGDSVDAVEASARALLGAAGVDGSGTLVFVDVFGATPCNAATRLLDRADVRLVAGVNVPMLWRTLCYGTRESLDTMVARAVAGAAQGVMPVTLTRPQTQAQKTPTSDQAKRHDQQ